MDWTERFASLVERKETEARGATLSPFATDSLLDAADLITVGNDWSRALFDGPFYLSPPPAGDLPAVGLVFVQSRDGNTGAADPATLGGGVTDKHLVYEGLSRVAADGVLAGATTIRGGDVVFSVWREELVALRAALGKPRHPAQIVATLGGLDIDDELLFNVPEMRVVVLTVGAGLARMRDALASRPWITPIVVAHRTDLASAFRRMRREGLARVSAVGGRTIATALIDAGLVQDVYLTTSPRPGGDRNTPIYPRPLATALVTRKHGTGEESGVVFEHVRLPALSHGEGKPDTT